MDSQKHKALFFIALIPTEPLFSRITELKVAFSQEYGSRHALKSPPHITLIPPFRADAKTIEHLGKDLKIFASRERAFSIQIHGYGAFKPRVIYLNVLGSETAMGFRNKLLSTVIPDKPVNKGKLHITLATRDLSVDMFHKAWSFCKDGYFSGSFVADRFFLLKHDGKKWQIEADFPLKDETSPVRS
jgi:2'-5' RNA ligase